MNSTEKRNKTKSCSVCNETKPLEEYHFRKTHSKKKGEYIYYFPYCRDCNVRKSIDWAKENREKKLENDRNYIKTPEITAKYKLINRKRAEEGKQREWQRKNKDKIRKYALRRSRKTHEIKHEEWTACKVYFHNACAYCGLTYDKHQQKYKQDLHKEHVDHEGTNDLSNCVPSCKVCNSEKHTESLDSWYVESNPKYSQERMNRISIWLQKEYRLFISQ